ncbi:hypothetical protein ACWGOE_07210 [Leucobacter chromiiresistens]
MELGEIVALVISFVGGTGFSKILDIIIGKVQGATDRKRAEVDRMAKLLADAEAKVVTANTRTEAAEARKDAAERDRRIVLELISATRRIALDHGVPLDRLPRVELDN